MSALTDQNRSAILEAWLGHMAKARVLTETRDAIGALLEPWIDAVFEAAAGDEATKNELFRLVALHGRSIGAEGKPASAATMQVVLLDRALESVSLLDSARRDVVLEMTRVIVDAHALGASQRQRARQVKDLREQSPVMRLGEKAVVGFLIGTMDPELIDALLGRVLRECARAGSRTGIVDVSGAAPDDDLFHHTIRGFTRSGELSNLHMVITGLRDPAATRRALEALGVDMQRITLEPDLAPVLERTLSATPWP